MIRSILTHRLSTAGLIFGLALTLFGIISCGGAENMSPPKISTGSALGDKLVNAMRTQLKVRLFLTEDVIASYLKQAVASGESMSFDGLEFRAPLSADARNYARIVYGLVSEIDKLNSVYSFGNAGIDEQSKKLRESILKLVLTYSRVFTNADLASAEKRAELGFASGYAAVAGFPASGLSDALKEAGLKEIKTSVFAAIKNAKWSSSESLSIFPDTAAALLIGTKGIELSKDLRITIVGDFSESSGNAIKDLETAETSVKIRSVTEKTCLLLGLLKSAGFAAQDLPDAAEPIIEKTISLLYDISSDKFTESTLSFAARIVDVTSPYLAAGQAEDAKLFYKKVSYRLIKDYKAKATTLPDGFATLIQTTMTARINSSKLDETRKSAALAGTAEGVTQIQTELNPPADPPADPPAETIF